MRHPSLVFHQSIVSDKRKISGTLILLNAGCLYKTYPASSGIAGMQDYKHQSENGGILPANNETKLPCYRVDTRGISTLGIQGLCYSIRPNILTCFGETRAIDFIHCDHNSTSYLNSIVLLTEQIGKNDFENNMHYINELGFFSIPLVVSYSRFDYIRL